jgi:hypothetical protein
VQLQILERDRVLGKTVGGRVNLIAAANFLQDLEIEVQVFFPYGKSSAVSRIRFGRTREHA